MRGMWTVNMECWANCPEPHIHARRWNCHRWRNPHAAIDLQPLRKRPILCCGAHSGSNIVHQHQLLPILCLLKHPDAEHQFSFYLTHFQKYETNLEDTITLNATNNQMQGNAQLTVFTWSGFRSRPLICVVRIQRCWPPARLMNRTLGCALA